MIACDRPNEPTARLFNERGRNTRSVLSCVSVRVTACLQGNPSRLLRTRPSGWGSVWHRSGGLLFLPLLSSFQSPPHLQSRLRTRQTGSSSAAPPGVGVLIGWLLQQQIQWRCLYIVELLEFVLSDCQVTAATKDPMTLLMYMVALLELFDCLVTAVTTD